MISPGPSIARSPLNRFIVLYALLYSAFGVASPFLPAFIEARGIPPEQIAMLFAAGTAIRLASAPLAGRFADRTQTLRLTLAICAMATAGRRRRWDCQC
jgi:PPP family 3-phenylpropionic acid transporter